MQKEFTVEERLERIREHLSRSKPRNELTAGTSRDRDAESALYGQELTTSQWGDSDDDGWTAWHDWPDRH